MNNEPSFSLKDFKKWLISSNESSIVFDENNKLKIGERVVIRLSEKNVISKIGYLNKDKDLLMENYNLLKKNGGIIKECDKNDIVVKVIDTNRSIIVPRIFLRRHKNKKSDSKRK
jgi:positive regulator of sigma E activity